ncbi:PH domain-containing protein [Ectobacillus sp. sgz5001026]|uniref:PH domain-containing protein n=1 Tax=Ectobacillus sp. sgz5001026 TaxID=3242473 RepID=UPI0036D3DD8B
MMNRREHPVTILFRSFKFLKSIVWGMIPFFVFTLKSMSVFTIFLLFIGLVSLTGIVATINWYFTIFRIEQDGLFVKKGVFTKKETFIQHDRVQSVSTHATLLHQFFHIEQVIVETAGGKVPEIDLYGVPVQDVSEIVMILKGSERRVHQEESKYTERTYHLTKKEMLLAGITSGQIGILFTILMGLWSQVNDWIPASYSQFIQNQAAHLSFYLWIMLAFVFLIISWVAATIQFIITYYGFRIVSSDNKLYIANGLLNKKNVTLPQKKIQGITIEEGVLRGLFGFASIKAEAVVSMKDSKVHTILLHPFISKKKIPAFLQYVVPQYNLQPIEEKAPRHSLKRFLFVKVVLAFLIASIVTIWNPILFPIFLLVILALWQGYACYRSAGFTIYEKQITLSYRKLAAYKTIILRKHIQSIGTEQTIFQKRDQVGTIRCHILSGLVGVCVKVKNLDTGQNKQIIAWFEERKIKHEEC